MTTAMAKVMEQLAENNDLTKQLDVTTKQLDVTMKDALEKDELIEAEVKKISDAI